jgi:hypothetical protein
MPRPSAADLIERLRDVYSDRDGTRASDEKLAGQLPITLSTLNRWKKGDTRAFDNIVLMLDEAGWLSPEAPAGTARNPQAALLAGVGALLRNQAEAMLALGVPEELIERPEIAPAPPRVDPGRPPR